MAKTRYTFSLMEGTDYFYKIVLSIVVIYSVFIGLDGNWFKAEGITLNITNNVFNSILLCNNGKNVYFALLFI